MTLDILCMLWDSESPYVNNLGDPVCVNCGCLMTVDEAEAGDYCEHCSDCPGCWFCAY